MNSEMTTDPQYSRPLRIKGYDLYRDGGTAYASLNDALGMQHDICFDKELHRPFYGTVHPDENTERLRYLNLSGHFSSEVISLLRSDGAQLALRLADWMCFYRDFGKPT